MVNLWKKMVVIFANSLLPPFSKENPYIYFRNLKYLKFKGKQSSKSTLINCLVKGKNFFMSNKYQKSV